MQFLSPSHFFVILDTWLCFGQVLACAPQNRLAYALEPRAYKMNKLLSSPKRHSMAHFSRKGTVFTKRHTEQYGADQRSLPCVARCGSQHHLGKCTTQSFRPFAGLLRSWLKQWSLIWPRSGSCGHCCLTRWVSKVSTLSWFWSYGGWRSSEFGRRHGHPRLPGTMHSALPSLLVIQLSYLEFRNKGLPTKKWWLATQMSYGQAIALRGARCAMTYRKAQKMIRSPKKTQPS